jgi:transposase InsO family protein
MGMSLLAIAAYLHRFHQILIARSTVHRVLTRHGMKRLPANQKHQPHGTRWQRYEKPQPGHRLQVDVKFLERIPGTRRRLYQFSAIDDCTRIRVFKVYDACNERDDEEFYQVLDKDGISDDIHLFNEKLREWEDYYNYHRSHGGLGGPTPYERLLAKAFPT